MSDDGRTPAPGPGAGSIPFPGSPPAPVATAGNETTEISSRGAPSRDEMTIALTPGQMAVGGAIIAGLLVVGARFLLGRRRGRG